MEIVTIKEDKTVVMMVKGRIDAVTTPEFEKSLSAFLNDDCVTLILNFKGLEYISSIGLRAILAAAKQLKTRNGRMCFAALQGSVKDVFKISGFGSIFKIYETEEEALQVY